MNILVIAMALFIVLEFLNIMLLYFAPGSQKGNALGAFKAFEKSKQDSDVHDLVRYLAYWVAGTKAIFIALLLVIIFTGTALTQTLAVAALILTIMLFYWKLYPLIKKMDKNDQIQPKGYSKTLGIMIAVFILVFLVALVVSLVI